MVPQIVGASILASSVIVGAPSVLSWVYVPAQTRLVPIQSSLVNHVLTFAGFSFVFHHGAPSGTAYVRHAGVGVINGVTYHIANNGMVEVVTQVSPPYWLV